MCNASKTSNLIGLYTKLKMRRVCYRLRRVPAGYVSVGTRPVHLDWLDDIVFNAAVGVRAAG